MPTIDDFCNYESLTEENHVFLIVEVPHESNSEIPNEICNAVQSIVKVLRQESQLLNNCQIKLSVLTFGTDCTWVDGPEPVPLSDFTWKGCSPSSQCNFGLALDELYTRISELSAKLSHVNRYYHLPIFCFLMHTTPTDSYQNALSKLQNVPFYRHGLQIALQFMEFDVPTCLKEIVDPDAIIGASDEKMIDIFCGRTLHCRPIIEFMPEPVDSDEFSLELHPSKLSSMECKESHGSRIPAHDIYSILASSESIKNIIEINTENLTDSQMAAWLFRKLDLLADATSNKQIGLSNDLSVCYRKSISPTGKFQAWIINSKILIFSEDSVWCAFQHALFLEGELIVRDTVWNENEESVIFTLFYIVHNECEKLKVFLSSSELQQDLAAYDVNLQSGTSHPRLETLMAYSEICVILNLLETSYADRVPEEVKMFFYEERLEEYEPQIDPSKPLNEQQLQRETFVLLALLNVNYWCDSEEERESYLKEMALNDNKEFDKNDTSWDLSRIFNKKVTIDFINGTSQVLLAGQTRVVTKGQVMPCASLEEYAQEIITLTYTQGKCRVKNRSGLVLNALITIKPGDSFGLQAQDLIFTDENSTISDLSVICITDNIDGWGDMCTLSIACHNGNSHTWEIDLGGFYEIKRCQLGPSAPETANDVIFKISLKDDGYQVTNVSPHTFSVIKEFQNKDYIDVETGCKISKQEDDWKALCIFMDITVCKSTPDLTTSTVPVQNPIVWDDGEW